MAGTEASRPAGKDVAFDGCAFDLLSAYVQSPGPNVSVSNWHEWRALVKASPEKACR